MMAEGDLLATIADIQDNEDNLRHLVEQLKTPIGIIPFVGAGLSIPFGFPGWGGFLIAEARKAGVEEAIQHQLDVGKFEEAAEDLLNARGYRAFHDAIGNSFGVHRLSGIEFTGAVSFLPQLAPGPVITTNFDHVLEEVFKRADSSFEYVVWGVRVDLATMALHQNRRFLLKIHGDAEDSTDRILTRSDYQKQYGSMDSSGIDLSLPLRRLLHQMLVGRPLLFLGCSLNQDRTVAVLEQITQSFRSGAHYAVVEQPALLEQLHERSRFLSDHNVRPIWYPNGRHDRIQSVLEYLIGQSSPHLSPQFASRSLLNNVRTMQGSSQTPNIGTDGGRSEGQRDIGAAEQLEGKFDFSSQVSDRLTSTANRIDQMFEDADARDLCRHLEAIQLVVKAHQALFVKFSTWLTGPQACAKEEYVAACGHAIKTYLEAEEISPRFTASLGALQVLIPEILLSGQDNQKAQSLLDSLEEYQRLLGKQFWSGLGVGQEDRWSLKTLMEKALNYNYGGGKIDAPIREIATIVFGNHDWGLTHTIYDLIAQIKMLSHCQDQDS